MKTAATITGISLALLTSFVMTNRSLGAAPEVPADQLGKQVEDFTLRDYRGRERSFHEFEGKPVAVHKASRADSLET